MTFSIAFGYLPVFQSSEMDKWGQTLSYLTSGFHQLYRFCQEVTSLEVLLAVGCHPPASYTKGTKGPVLGAIWGRAVAVLCSP